MGFEAEGYELIEDALHERRLAGKYLSSGIEG